MFQGPSAGPSMLLNVLMRWPALIPIAAISGIGMYKYQDLRELIEPPVVQQATLEPVKAAAKEDQARTFQPIAQSKVQPALRDYAFTSTSLKQK